MIKRTIVCALAFVLVACGGDDDGGKNAAESSGLPAGNAITSLTEQDVGVLCQWSEAYLGGNGTTLACNFSVQGRDECAAGIRGYSSSCKLTVADYEGCMRAMRADACLAFGTACQELLACSF